MLFYELILMAIAVSMDAFAVSISQGLCMSELKLKKTLIVGMYFGISQAVMPLIGYFLAKQFAVYITSLDHWLAFLLLSFIGGKMIRDSMNKEGEGECNIEDLSLKAMIPLAIATSIDALAVGVSFAFLNVVILPAVSFIGITTFLFSLLGVVIGYKFGSKYKSKAEFAGGLILVILGLKILIEHTLL